MDKNEVKKLSDQSINIIKNYVDSLVNSKNQDDVKKASLFSYWLKDYVFFLKKEVTFDPKKIIKYNRGDIIKVNLG